MFSVYKNVLRESQYWVVWNTLRKGNWVLEGFSNEENQMPIWYKDLIHDPFWNKSFPDKISEITGKKLVAHRVYANGQTTGQCGGLHFDDDRDNAYTFLYYVNPNWHASWGGQTVFADESGMKSYMPEANTGVFFKGTTHHVGLEPTSHFKDLRITVAAKLLEME